MTTPKTKKAKRVLTPIEKLRATNKELRAQLKAQDVDRMEAYQKGNKIRDELRDRIEGYDLARVRDEGDLRRLKANNFTLITDTIIARRSLYALIELIKTFHDVRTPTNAEGAMETTTEEMLILSRLEGQTNDIYYNLPSYKVPREDA